MLDTISGVYAFIKVNGKARRRANGNSNQIPQSI